MLTDFFGEWLKDKSVRETKLFLTNDGFILGRNNADTADLNVAKINTSDELEFGILPVYAGTIDALTPNTALVTKEYVLNVLAGQRDPKDAVRVASTGNIDLSSVPASIDGVAMAAGERFLAKDQTDPIENGWYDYPAGGAGNAAVRSTDADEDSEVTQGSSSLVAEGLVNAHRQYMVSSPDPLVVGTDALAFVRIPNPADLVIQLTEVLDLDATDLDTNGYKDLAVAALHPSIEFNPKGGVLQEAGVDYTIADNLGVTRLTFGTSGTAGSLGEKLKLILTNYGSSKVIVHYERLAN